ncbi:hypothetical protein [Streptomyces avermitilis]|uniref:Uncharacterized protein n=1 Tax=Streptomyces avermitilis TaxID=33903 RepID=A0A4D4M955_STRAX|nr:hypothetical protein [Streptomyces avermitilis]GDY68334.1 hypothetical protein SAV14893_077270 [Streptomyces avermitilis]GDY71304.1 hypothetical protein SAV31267_007890 [Streptomyces avermitilis]
MSAPGFAAAQWTRATGAGVNPHEYRRVTDGLTSVADWGPSFLRTGHAYLERAEDAGSPVSAGEHLLMAGRRFHLATLAPYAEARRAADEADHTLSKTLAVLEPGARRGGDATEVLQRPGEAEGRTLDAGCGLGCVGRDLVHRRSCR